MVVADHPRHHPDPIFVLPHVDELRFAADISRIPRPVPKPMNPNLHRPIPLQPDTPPTTPAPASAPPSRRCSSASPPETQPSPPSIPSGRDKTPGHRTPSAPASSDRNGYTRRKAWYPTPPPSASTPPAPPPAQEPAPPRGREPLTPQPDTPRSKSPPSSSLISNTSCALCYAPQAVLVPAQPLTHRKPGPRDILAAGPFCFAAFTSRHWNR